MGKCFSCFKKHEAEHVESEVKNVMFCKPGPIGKLISIKTENDMIHISGKGTFLGSYPLDCDTGYWEVVLGAQSQGVRVGVRRYNPKDPPSLEKSLEDDAWFLRCDDIETNTVVGIYWDQTDLPMLAFSLNGTMTDKHSISRIRPSNNVYPAISVEQGSDCTAAFIDTSFKYPPVSRHKFKMIVGAVNLI